MRKKRITLVFLLVSFIIFLSLSVFAGTAGITGPVGTTTTTIPTTTTTTIPYLMTTTTTSTTTTIPYLTTTTTTIPVIQPKSTSYIYANGRRMAKIVHNRNGTKEAFYLHNDHLGSPAAITNNNGKVIWKADYKPFGETFNEVSLNGPSDIKYNSKELDYDTELHYYGARYYNSEVGRFITADTIKGSLADPQSLNLYVYVKNNPMKYIDPKGKQGQNILKNVLELGEIDFERVSEYNQKQLEENQRIDKWQREATSPISLREALKQDESSMGWVIKKIFPVEAITTLSDATINPESVSNKEIASAAGTASFAFMSSVIGGEVLTGPLKALAPRLSRVVGSGLKKVVGDVAADVGEVSIGGVVASMSRKLVEVGLKETRVGGKIIGSIERELGKETRRFVSGSAGRVSYEGGKEIFSEENKKKI